MLPLLVLLSLSSLLERGRGQTLSWKTLPTGIQLLPSDTLSLPIDEYLSFSGAKVTVTGPPSSRVSLRQKINQISSVTSTNPLFKKCTLNVFLTPIIYILCDNIHLFKVEIDLALLTIKSLSSITLYGTSVLNKQPACTDLVLTSDNRGLVFVCYDPSSPSSIYIYDTLLSFNPSVDPAFTVNPSTYLRISLCQNTNTHLTGGLRMSVLKTTAFGDLSVVLFVQGPSNDPPVATGMRLLSCFIPAPNPTATPSSNPSTVSSFTTDLNSIFSSLTSQFPLSVGNIKAMIHLSTDSGSFSVAFTSMTTVSDSNAILTGVVQVRGLTSNPSSPAEVIADPAYTLKAYQSSSINSLFIHQSTVYMRLSSPGLFFIADGKNLAKLTALISTAALKTIELTFAYMVAMDCGAVALHSAFGSMPFIIKLPPQPPVSYTGNNYSEDRVLVDFRTKASPYELREFYMYIDASHYACSRASDLGDSSKLQGHIYPGLVYNNYQVWTTKDSSLTFYRVHPNTLLNITTNSQTGTLAFILNTAITGLTSPDPVVFSVEGLASSTSLNRYTSTNQAVKVYNKSRLLLPVPFGNFEGNKPVYSSTSPQVKILHSIIYSLTSLLNIDSTLFPLGIHRTYAVDNNTFLSVLRQASGQEAFSVVRTTINTAAAFSADNTLTVDSTSTPSPSVSLNTGQSVLKVVKVGDAAFCIFISGQTTSDRLSVRCFTDSGASPEITPSPIIVSPPVTWTVVEVFPIESVLSNTLDVLLILATPSSATISGQSTVLWTNKVHFCSLSFDPYSNSVIQRVALTPLSPEALSNTLVGCSPQDISADYSLDREDKTTITIRYLCGNYPAVSRNVLARFALNAAGSSPVLLYSRVVGLPAGFSAYCICQGEVVVYSARQGKIFALKAGSTDPITPVQKYLYPLKDLGVSKVIQFVCVSEVGMVQVLGLGGSGKMLLTLRGGQTEKGGSRVHSQQPLAASVDFIESTVTRDVVITVCSSPGDSTKTRHIVYTYASGPLFGIDVTTSSSSLTFPVKPTVGLSSVDISLSVDIVNPVTIASVTPITRFNIIPGQTVSLDDVADISGPVLETGLSGNTTNITILKRIDRFKTYSPSLNSNSVPDKIVVENDFMVLLYKDLNINIYGDPQVNKFPAATSPKSILTLGNNTSLPKDMVLLSSSTVLAAILVTKTLEAGMNVYRVYLLTSNGVLPNPTYQVTSSASTFSTQIDYSNLHIVESSGGNLYLSISNPSVYGRSYVKILCFTKTAQSQYVFSSEVNFMSPPGRQMGSHWMSHTGDDGILLITSTPNRTGLLVGRYKNGDGGPSERVLNVSSLYFSLFNKVTRPSMVSVVQCWPKPVGKVECVMALEGIVAGVLEVTVATDTSLIDPLASITQTAEFEIPPGFSIVKADRTQDYYGFLLAKQQLSRLLVSGSRRRRLQTLNPIGNYTQCAQYIAFYRPAKNRFLNTAISCTEFGSLSNVDFSMDYDSKSYVYFTKATSPFRMRVLQTNNTDKIGVNVLSNLSVRLSGIADPFAVNLTLVGLGGTGSSDQKVLPLQDLMYPKSSGLFNGGIGQFIDTRAILLYTLLFFLVLAVIIISTVLYCKLKGSIQPKRINPAFDPQLSPSPQKGSLPAPPLDFSSQFLRPGWSAYKRIDQHMMTDDNEPFDEFGLAFL